MSRVREIEKQIRKLSKEEFAELRDWLAEQDWDAWDAQIASDSRSGKLDSLVSEGKAEYDAGRARKL